MNEVSQKGMCEGHFDALVVHYAEIALKRGNRAYFENMLIRNMKTAAGRGIECDIQKLSGRLALFPRGGRDVGGYAKRLARVFGISNIAIARRVKPKIEAIRDAAVEIATLKDFRTFAIRARRGDKIASMNSQDVNIDVGAAVQGATGARVDLETPEITIAIEILRDHAFVYADTVPGPGGLPIGTGGKVGCLISGGIDSPVAAWRMMKRGCEPTFIHFHSAPFTGPESQDKVEDILLHILAGQPDALLIMVPFGGIQRRIVTGVPTKYRVVMYRRFMIRIASELARQRGLAALVTGEALAQVASQTLYNLAAIDDVAAIPILRPLIGMDKDEIVREARRIGTFDISIKPHDDCCSFLTPRHPVTRSDAKELSGVESSLDVGALVEQGVKECATKRIRHIELT